MSTGIEGDDLWVTVMCKGLPYPFLTGTSLGESRLQGVGSGLQAPEGHGHSEQLLKLNQTQQGEIIGRPTGSVGRDLSWQGPLCKNVRSLVWRRI